MSIPEIIIFVFIAVIVILTPLFLAFMNSRISVSIEHNAVRRATYEIAENLLNSDISRNGGLLLGKLNELDGASTEPVRHCYAYHVTVTSPQKLDNKNSWSFGFNGKDDVFSVALPVYIHSNGIFPANLKVSVYDTKVERCGK